MNIKMVFPPAADRTAWQDALKKNHTRELKKYVMVRAKELLSEPIPELLASHFMEYVRCGDRRHFESFYFARRINLNVLVLAECFEYKGRFIDRIIDYIWAITSEHSWVVPAHCYLEDDPFPEFPVGNVDLFNSETGLELAMTMNLLEKEISAISPNFIKMIRNEIISRIVVPLEEGPEPFWYGGLNNWTPWCCSNSLTAILWALRDEPERCQKLVDTLHNGIKNFIKFYPEDGFCFEGPAYWVVSPGRMLYFLEQLDIWYDDPKIKPMAEYIADTCISEDRSMNFGDSWSKVAYTPWQIYRFGERLNNDYLRSTAMDCMTRTDNKMILMEIFNSLGYIFWLPAKKIKGSFRGDSLSFYPETQFFILRRQGVFIAAKRGHAWSHHHMDIGHFMLYDNGDPIIIDRGSSEYTKNTFTDKRFLNDILNGEGHNMLHFNGFSQFTESDPAPGAMTVAEDKDFIRCRMDLTTAYVPEAKVKSCIRELVYDCRNKVLNVCDDWELDTDDNDIYVNFFTPAKVVEKDGRLHIGKVIFTVENCEITVRKVKNTDPVQIINWGKSLTEIKIRKKSARKGNLKLSFDLNSKGKRK